MTTDEMIEVMARAAYAKVSETSVDSPHVKYVFACRETDYGEDADTWYYAQGFRSAQRAALAAILPVLREDIAAEATGMADRVKGIGLDNEARVAVHLAAETLAKVIRARFDEIAKEIGHDA